jgi:hypothetical protein
MWFALIRLKTESVRQGEGYVHTGKGYTECEWQPI